MTQPATNDQPTVGHYRWFICSLLFLATTVNYIDRQILGILAPVLQSQIRWSESDYGWIVFAFTSAYALGVLFFGWFVDRYGTKIGYTVSVLWWSVAAMAHALVRTPLGFGAARAGLGLSESGNFPAAVKAIAEWFPKKERALATGIFNSGANIGAVAAPAVVPWLTVTYGWQAAFIATGSLGFLWVILWVIFYDTPERHKSVAPGELAYITSDVGETSSVKVPWLQLLRYRQTWAFVIGKFLTDPIWWFYLYWLPKMLNKSFGLTLTSLGLPLIAVYTMTTIGSVGGGWLSSSLIRRGGRIGRSRSLAMLTCAICVVPIVFVSYVSQLWIAVGLFGLAAAAHQGWSANIFTTASDNFPKRAVGSVIGLGTMAGSVGGMVFQPVTGYVLQWTGSYLPLLIVAGSAYLIALGIMVLLTRTAKPVEL
jgi:ACS family hexuronate transporter-like MFS transporter